MDGQLDGVVAAEGIAGDLEGDVPGESGQVLFGAAEVDGIAHLAALFEAEFEVAVFEDSGLVGDGDTADHENGFGVGGAERLEE